MSQVLSLPAAQWAIMVAVLASLVVVGIYVVGKARAGFTGQEPDASELLTTFRELHSEGGLSDEEYRNIKTKLASRLQREATRNEPKTAGAESPEDREEN